MTSILRRAFISISLWRFGGVLAREADAKRVPGDGKGGAFRRTHPWGKLPHYRGGNSWASPILSADSWNKKSSL